MKFIAAGLLVLILATSGHGYSKKADIMEGALVDDLEVYTKIESTCCIKPALSKPPIWMCPEPDDSIRCLWCHDECVSDYQCGPGRKCCCQPGCGNQCIHGKVNVKPSTKTQKKV